MTREKKDEQAAIPPPPFELTVTRTVIVRGIKTGRPSLELEVAGDEVRVAVLPRNSSSRELISLSDLANAVHALQDTPR